MSLVQRSDEMEMKGLNNEASSKRVPLDGPEALGPFSGFEWSI